MPSKPNPPRILVLNSNPEHLTDPAKVRAQVREWCNNPARRDWLRTTLKEGRPDAA